MRVIAGTYRSRPLTAPRGMATRPTSDRLREVESLAASEVRSLVCVPLTVFQRVIGCIYLDSTNPAVMEAGLKLAGGRCIRLPLMPPGFRRRSGH